MDADQHVHAAVPEPPPAVRRRARTVPTPAYIYDLAGLRAHAAAVRAAVPVELFYAVKANPDARVLAAIAPYVDGVEVSSGGELAHVRRTLPGARIAFGGPGKTAGELAAATGYFDQSHMTTDFRTLMGVPPRSYLTGRLPALSPCRASRDGG